MSARDTNALDGGRGASGNWPESVSKSGSPVKDEAPRKGPPTSAFHPIGLHGQDSMLDLFRRAEFWQSEDVE